MIAFMIGVLPIPNNSLSAVNNAECFHTYNIAFIGSEIKHFIALLKVFLDY